MRKVRRPSEAGFTLIELLLVVALTALAVGVTSDILISVIRSYSKSQVINEIEQNANFISQKLTKELRNATVIEYLEPAPTGNVPPLAGDSYYEITFLDRQGNTVNYTINGGVMTRDAGLGSQNLTVNTPPSGVTVSCISGNACFTLIESSPQVIQIAISMTQAGSVASVVFEGDLTIEDTVVVRDTY